MKNFIFFIKQDMKYLMLFVDGFEDVEAIATLDVLVRGHETVDAVSLMGRKNIATKCGNVLTIPYTLDEIDPTSYDALIIPGGPGSFKIMPDLEEVSKLIEYFVSQNKLVASICAAPHLVGRLGYFKELSYTVHPGFETKIIGGTYLREKGVVRDGNFITAKSMYYSIAFGLEIYEYFHGKEQRDALEKACMGE